MIWRRETRKRKKAQRDTRHVAMKPEDVVRTACRVIWSEGRTERIGEFYAENFSADYPTTNWGDGLAGIEALVTQIRSAFPDYHEQIDELIVAGDKVIVRLTITATHRGDMPSIPATGRQVAFRDVTVCRVENGKIAQQWGVSDMLTLYTQLGVVQLPGS